MNSARSPRARKANAALEPQLASISNLLAQGDHRAAFDACERLSDADSPEPAVLRLQGKAAEGLGDLASALELAQAAVQLRPRNVRARLRLARCLWRIGQAREALAQAEQVASTARSRPGALLRVAEFFATIGEAAAAYGCRQQALALRPEDPVVLVAMADSAALAGETEAAEQLYDRALYQDPTQYTLLERRSLLRKRSEADHKAAQLGYTLDSLAKDDPRRAPVCYALARELEDLGHFEPAFGIWSEGARCRLLALREDPARDRETLERCVEFFDEAWLRGEGNPEAGAGLVFLTGLPGCGLELLARRLADLKIGRVMRDSGFFGDAVTRLAGSADSTVARLQAAVTVDPTALAAAYEATMRQVTTAPPRFVDVSATHVGWLGLIRKALPAAKILHLRRDPLDHCLALYTTLFPRGHGWSYDLDALGRHYATYHRLMGHWRRHLPQGFLDLDYERWVLESEQETEQAVERLMAFLEMDREDVPVRPVDQTPSPGADPRGSGIERWKHYERELGPLAERLRADGVPVG